MYTLEHRTFPGPLRKKENKTNVFGCCVRILVGWVVFSDVVSGVLAMQKKTNVFNTLSYNLSRNSNK